MSSSLPRWVLTNAQSIEREAEPYRRMTVEERGRLMAAACRSAARMLQSRPDRDRVLAHRDPLPASTVEALRRMRQHGT